MRTILLFVLLLITTCITAQVKSMSQLVGYSKMKYAALEAKINGSYWVVDEKGKMDTLTYTRWRPKTVTAENSGEMLMCYCKGKNKAVDYIVFQSLDKKLWDPFTKEVLKLGFKFAKEEKKGAEKKEIYSNGKTNISIVSAKPEGMTQMLYMFGIKVM